MEANLLHSRVAVGEEIAARRGPLAQKTALPTMGFKQVSHDSSIAKMIALSRKLPAAGLGRAKSATLPFTG